MAKKKNKTTTFWVIGIMLLVGVFAYNSGVFEGSFVVAGVGFTPIYCNDYSFTCCDEQLDSTQSVTITSKDELICPTTSTKCEITGTLGGGTPPQLFIIGSGNCNYGWWSGWSCDTERETTSSPILKPGEYLWINYGFGVNVQNKVYKEKLFFTGRAGSTIGVPVSGADGCTFNPTATYKDGDLVEYDVSGTSYVVPGGQCIQTFVPGDRHICGNIEEQCADNSDCGGHTYGNQECIGRNLQTYGCTKFGLPYYLETYGSAIAYKPFEGDNDGDESALSRCELVSSKTVQCCGDNDCGSNAFCDKSTWTCEATAQCGQDSDCGSSEQCDRNDMIIKKPVCVGGSCGFETLKDVDCCIDTDCPSGYFCDNEKTCKESAIHKINCPFDCCVGEDQYFDRPCSTDEPFCIDNVCQSEYEPPTDCADCDAFAMNKIFGSFWESQSCKPKFLIHNNTFCLFSFIKLALVPIALIFGTLFGVGLFGKFKAIKKNKPVIWILSLLVASILAFLVYTLFFIGIVVLIILGILRGVFR